MSISTTSTGVSGIDGGTPYQVDLPSGTAFYVAMINNYDYPRHFYITVVGQPANSGPTSINIQAHSGQVASYKAGSGKVIIQVADSEGHGLNLVDKGQQIGTGEYVDIGGMKPKGQDSGYDSTYDDNDVMMTLFWSTTAKKG